MPQLSCFARRSDFVLGTDVRNGAFGRMQSRAAPMRLTPRMTNRITPIAVTTANSDSLPRLATSPISPITKRDTLVAPATKYKIA